MNAIDNKKCESKDSCDEIKNTYVKAFEKYWKCIDTEAKKYDSDRTINDGGHYKPTKCRFLENTK